MKALSRRQLLQLTSGFGLASIVPQPFPSFAGMWSQL